VAVHRGGPLDLARHHALAAWAADCAAHVLSLFTRAHPDDDRPRLAVDAARAWARGEIPVGAARAAAVAAHAAARAARDEASCAVARACGHAAATAHMADPSLGAAYYAVKAARLASPAARAQAADARERHRQRERLPEAVRDLVVSAQEQGSVLGPGEGRAERPGRPR